MRSRIRSAFALATLVAVALCCAPGPLHASDADLQQYNRTAMNVEAACGLAPLTSPLYLPTDGKRITADSNAAGSAPVNRGLKQAADYWTCVRCAVIGDCAGVNQRTLKSVAVDGTGGVTSSAAAGTIAASLVRGGTSKPQTANPHGVITKDSPVFGFGSFSWNGMAYTFVGGFNVYDIAIISTGVVDVTYSSAPTNYLQCAGSANSYFNSGAAFDIEVTPSAPVGGRLVVRYSARDSGGSPAHTGFTTLVFCGAGS